MTDWDAQSIAILIGGIIGMVTLWGIFLWSLGRQKD
jgi:hypothetical protein